MLRCDDSPDESIVSGRSGRTGVSGRTGGNESYFDEEYEDGDYADEDHFDQFEPGRRPDPFDLPSPYERGRAQRAANQNRLPKRRGSSAGRQSAGVGGSGAGGLRRHNSSVGGRDGFGGTPDRDRNYGSLRKSKDHHRSNPQLSNIPFEPHRSNRDLLSPPGSERGDYRENRNRDFDNYKRGINRDRGLDIGREFDRRMPKRSGSAMDLRGLDRGLDTGSRGRLDFDRNLDRRDHRNNDRDHHRQRNNARDDSHSRSMKNLSRISQSIRDIRGTSEEDLELINA